MNDELEKTFQLPDRNTITLGKERMECPEALFQPLIAGSECDGLHVLGNQSILQYEVKELYSNIVLAGSSMLFDGIPERMEKEFVKLSAPGTKVKVVSPANRKTLIGLEGQF